MLVQDREELQELVNDFKDMMRTVATDPSIDSADLRLVLRFLTKVVNVVNQAFQDVFAILIEFKYLTPADFATPKLVSLQKELDLIRARSRYRDAEEICSRLKNFSQHYQSEIEPIIHSLQKPKNWNSIFYLLNEHEGRIIWLVNDTIRKLELMLNQVQNPEQINDISVFATRKIEVIRKALGQLQSLNSQILGLSGKAGFLETTEDRSSLSRRTNLFINRSNRVGDNYNVSGQAGAVGPNAHAHDMTFTQIGSQIEKSVSLDQLAVELAKLRQAMKQEATEAEHDGAVGDVSKAEQAAKAGDSGKVAEYLKSAGNWALDVATKIGTNIAVEAMKTAMGMK